MTPGQAPSESLYGEWTPEQIADFMAELRAFLSENVTIVKPGETLVIRVTDFTPGQLHDYQRSFSEASDAGLIPFRVMVVYGDELGVVSAGSDA